MCNILTRGRATSVFLVCWIALSYIGGGNWVSFPCVGCSNSCARGKTNTWNWKIWWGKGCQVLCINFVLCMLRSWPAWGLYVLLQCKCLAMINCNVWQRDLVCKDTWKNNLQSFPWNELVSRFLFFQRGWTECFHSECAGMIFSGQHLVLIVVNQIILIEITYWTFFSPCVYDALILWMFLFFFSQK